jgi:hypothetical protein
VLAAVEDDCVQGAVQLPVAAAAEPLPPRLTARGGDRGDAGEPCEGGLGADSASVRPADDQLAGDDRADARLVEQLWRERADVREDLALELGRFARGRFYPPGKAAQDEPRRELVRSRCC